MDYTTPQIPESALLLEVPSLIIKVLFLAHGFIHVWPVKAQK